MITLTDTAATKVKELLDAEGEPEMALRVAVRPGGCSGLLLRDVLRRRHRRRGRAGRVQRRARSSSTRPARSCSSAPRSTTRTACRRPVSASTTPTPPAPAAAATASADPAVPALSAAGEVERGSSVAAASLDRSNRASAGRATSMPAGVGDEQDRLEVQLVGGDRRRDGLDGVVGVDLGVDHRQSGRLLLLVEQQVEHGSAHGGLAVGRRADQVGDAARRGRGRADRLLSCSGQAGSRVQIGSTPRAVAGGGRVERRQRLADLRDRRRRPARRRRPRWSPPRCR